MNNLGWLFLSLPISYLFNVVIDLHLYFCEIYYILGLIALVSMLIYGIGYLPIVLGISLECPSGYLAATLLSWIYTVEFFINAFCRQENAVRILFHKS